MLVLALTLAAATAARIGTIEVAAHQVVAQLWFLLAMIVDALAISAQALVAELAGREDRAGARSLSDRLLRWGVAAGMLLGVVVAGLGHLLAPIFTPDPTVQAAIRSVLLVAAVMQPIAAWVFVADGIYLALLRIRLLALSTAAGLAAVVVVLGFTLAGGWGLLGVWWAITAMIAGRALVLGWAHYSSTLPSS
jgi:Na+-driven multidrug efflux pump